MACTAHRRKCVNQQTRSKVRPRDASDGGYLFVVYGPRGQRVLGQRDSGAPGNATAMLADGKDQRVPASK